MFKNKVLLITGGTGSFGNAVVRRFLPTEIGEIRIFSRDEKKQDDMRQELYNPKLKFYIGDVRSFNSIQNAMRGVDYVFNAAARPRREFHADGRLKSTQEPLVRVLTRKPVLPEQDEIRANPRSHSAKLRVAERLSAGEGA